MRSLFIAIVFAFAGVLAAQEPITCSGTWAPAMSEQALIREFGRANVVRGTVYVAEGNEVPGTILFPNDETKRVEIVWRDARKRRRPEWLRVPDGSRWRAPGGVRIGMSIAEVEKLNGRAFELSGFDWDYGGMVTNLHGGSLGTSGSPCRIQLRFDRIVPEDPTPKEQKAIDATSGDRSLMSSSPDLRAFPVRLSEIVIQYPE